MTTSLLRVRRLLVVLIALSMLAPFARPVLSELLVDRGVGLILQGDYQNASRFISRAMWIDPAVTNAVDLASMYMTMTVRPEELKTVRASADRYVATHPNDSNVRWDRMVLEMKANDLPAALSDARTLRRMLPENRQIPVLLRAIEDGLR